MRAELNARRAGTHAAEEPRLRRRRPLEAVAAEGERAAPAPARFAPQSQAAVSRSPDAPELRRQGQQKSAPRRARAALSAHAGGARSASSRTTCSTRRPPEPSELLGTGAGLPLLVIAEVEQENVVKSFRNLPGVFVVASAETEVAELVWARSVLATETALQRSRRASSCASLDIRQVLLAPVVSEKSYNQIDENRYTFKVRKDAHRLQVRQAVEELFGVHVLRVNMAKVPSSPSGAGCRRAASRAGRRPSCRSARRNDRDLRAQV